jgi:hypothetical protein
MQCLIPAVIHEGEPTNIMAGDVIIYQKEAKTIHINRIGKKSNVLKFCNNMSIDDKLYLGMNLSDEEVKNLMTGLAETAACNHNFLQLGGNLICLLS